MSNNTKVKHVVCYSGGHSSAIVAIEVVRKFGKEGVILLNHDISSTVESKDIKRFKKEVSEFLEVDVTYANIQGISEVSDIPDQFDVVMKAGAFKVGNGSELCTSRLKTEPFMKWMKENDQEKKAIVYYGFDANEQVRIQRRSGIMGNLGWKTDYPLALWKERTIFSTEEIGILPPNTYEKFKHGNCVGCLKAGKQHWYIVYCTRKDIWEKAKLAEEDIGYSIINGEYLYEMEEMFEKMRLAGIPQTEHIKHQTFWAQAKKIVNSPSLIEDNKPCECVF